MTKDAAEHRDKVIVAIVWTVLIAAVIIWVGSYYWGTARPGAFLERGQDYEAKMIVRLYPDDSEAKNYELPADISKLDGYYRLDRVYWPNGGYVDFDDCDVVIDEKSTCSYLPDDADDYTYYDVVLTTTSADK